MTDTWTTKINLDSDKPDVGLVTLVCNEGLADEFRFSRRSKTDAKSIEVLMELAMTEKAEVDAKAAAEAALEAERNATVTSFVAVKEAALPEVK